MTAGPQVCVDCVSARIANDAQEPGGISAGK